MHKLAFSNRICSQMASNILLFWIKYNQGNEHGVQEAGGSNPLTQTIKTLGNTAFPRVFYFSSTHFSTHFYFMSSTLLSADESLKTHRFQALRLSKKGYAEHKEKSNSATCAVNLVFSKHKRRENNTHSQNCARKIVRFSAIRSFLPTHQKSSDF